MRFIFSEDQVIKLKENLSKSNLNEDLLDDLISKGSQYLNKGIQAGKDFISGLDVDVEKKSSDVPAKADFIGDNVEDFFKILEGIDKPVVEQKYGSMVHQQSVEAIQIALQLLGYELPKFGTDGLFGPETANAVNQYKNDKGIKDADTIDTSSDLQEASMIPPIPIQAGKSYRWNEMRKYGRHKGVDLPAKVGTPIKNIADGTVIAAGRLDWRCGDGISIKHADGFVSSYCHLSGIKVTKGQNVSQGDVIGLTGGEVGAPGSGNSSGPHLHLTLKKDGNRVNPLEYFGSSIGIYYPSAEDSSSDSSDDTFDGAIVPVGMVKKLIEDLKTKNISSENIKQFVDPAVTTGGSVDFTDLDLTNKSDVNTYKEICNNYIKQKNPTAQVTGEMMANSAESVYRRYRKYVPPELALAQLTLEGGISKDTSNRPIRTKNPFNVGNTPTKSNPRPTFEDGVNIYYDLIARRYLVNRRTAKDLINDFKNDDGNSYADVGYETKLKELVKEIRRKSEPIYARLNKPSTQTISEDLLAEADKRQAIKNAFGFSDDWANEFHNLSDKLSIWIADTFIKAIIQQYRNEIPQGEDPKRYMIQGLNGGGPSATHDWRSTYRDKYEYILHWIRAPRREQINIRELSLDDAYQMAQEWHDTLQVKKQTNYQESGDVFIDYRNAEGVGYYWVHLHKSYCGEEAERMGHCARSNNGELISFRRVNEFGEGESYLTVDYRRGGIVGDFHRHGNKKPTARFHKQIVDFLINKTYPVTQLTQQGVHRYEDNFQLSDLSPDDLRKVYSENTTLRFDINNKDNWPEIINAILAGEVNFEQFSNKVKAELFAMSIDIQKGEQFGEKFTDRIIVQVINDFDEIPTLIKNIFVNNFGEKINQILIKEFKKKKTIDSAREHFIDSLREISQKLFDYYQMFCEYIDQGFKVFQEEERVNIASQRGIKRTLLSCTDSLPFLARFIDNSPVDSNGNVAVKTEEGFWGLAKQNGEIILHPHFLGMTQNKADKSGKTYIVKNTDNRLFLLNIETGSTTPFGIKS